MLAAVPLGLCIGLAVGMLGGGGSVLTVPVLVYLLGQSVPEATTASLAVVVAGSAAGGLAHAREGRVCWRHAASLTAAAVPGVVAGTVAGNAAGGKLLIGSFAVVMLTAAALTWRKACGDTGAADSWEGRAECPPLRLRRDLSAGVTVGFLTGFFGVGGGFLVVPTLALALAFTMRTAVGTSLAIITVSSLLGLGVHLLAGRTLDVGVTLAMSVACAAGALTGAALASKAPERTLGQAFSALLVAVAAYLLVSVTLLGGPPGG